MADIHTVYRTLLDIVRIAIHGIVLMIKLSIIIHNTRSTIYAAACNTAAE